MRKLKRLSLSSRTLRFLKNERTDKIAAKATETEKIKEAARLWKLKNNKAFEEIKRKLKEMAPGNQRCMYCEDSAGTDIEHFYPKSTHPLLAFTWKNYLLACSYCNSNCKRNEFPTDAEGRPLLIDPTVEDPREHIDLSFTNGSYHHVTKKGKESIRVYGLNRPPLKIGRSDALVSVQVHIIEYGHSRRKGDIARAHKIRETLCRFPHISVFIAVLDAADKQEAAEVLDPMCLETIREFPEIRDWPVL